MLNHAPSKKYLNMNSTKLLTSIVFAFTAFASSLSHSTSFNNIGFIEPLPMSELWINSGMQSYHFAKDQNFNNDNHGLGVEYAFNTVASVTIGEYANSVRNQTNYAGIYYHPIELGPIKTGVVAGVLNGYPAMNQGHYFAALLPTISTEYKWVGVNLYFIPPVGHSTYSVLSAQLKFRIFN
jgi:hypothetical protein